MGFELFLPILDTLILGARNTGAVRWFKFYAGWANKMLPLFNHTQVFKCEFIQNFYSKICDKKH